MRRVLYCIAALLVTTSAARAQNTPVDDVDATIYAGGSTGYSVVVVTLDPCGSYPVDTQARSFTQTMLRLAQRHADVRVSLTPAHTDEAGIPIDWAITAIAPRAHGQRDAAAICTTSASGAVFQGVLTSYTMGRITGHVGVKLPTGREVDFPFPAAATPVFAGTPLPACQDAEVDCPRWPAPVVIGSSVVRVHLTTTIAPSGAFTDYVTRIDVVK